MQEKSPEQHNEGVQNLFHEFERDMASAEQLFSPLLTKLSSKFLSAPATSAESERLFSTAGLIVNNLRKRLLPSNVEKLLFLHHNLTIYDFDYE